jgi:hypothetical protein
MPSATGLCHIKSKQINCLCDLIRSLWRAFAAFSAPQSVESTIDTPQQISMLAASIFAPGAPMNRLLLPAACLAIGLLAGSPASGADDATACLPGGEGRLQMEISGYFDATLDWGNAGTRCAGGPRPEGDALRLMFGRADDALMVVIAIAGLERGAVGARLPANLTVVREGRGEFFGTLGADSCLVEVTENAALADAPDSYRVSGSGRCLAPIEAVAGSSEIRIAPFEFTGFAEWPVETAVEPGSE